MRNLYARACRILALPPRVAAWRVVEYGVRQLRRFFGRARDRWQGSYGKKPMTGHLARLLPAVVPPNRGLEEICAQYLAHRFDLLGSGWVRVRHGMVCRGLEGHCYEMDVQCEPDREGRWLLGRINASNLGEAQRIWQLISDESGDWALVGYQPIDWQLDFKSGYRWSESTWYMDIPFGHKPGVDVKVPWELARMQHLPQMAILASSVTGNSADQDRLVREFRAQVLDFIATNPPRYGVNWHCTMDVAIRAANWLIAYDLFRAAGVTFDEGFDHVFHRSIYEHGRHVVANLEIANVKRGNHYLADIVGLLFVAAYLPRTEETDAWLGFAIRELIREVHSQFASDGTNFENSTCYHRLSAEMVIYATALIMGLPSEKRFALNSDERQLTATCRALGSALKPNDDRLPLERLDLFPAWYVERLERMGEFVLHITKPNSRVVQIGDNDSGRFVKLGAAYQSMTVKVATERYANLRGYQQFTELKSEEVYWQEDHLDHRHIVAALGVLFDRPDFLAFGCGDRLEHSVLKGYSKGAVFPSYHCLNESKGAETVRLGTIHDWDGALTRIAELSKSAARTCHISIPGGGVCADMAHFGYQGFGLYVYRTARIYLAIRCGPAILGGNGAHAHNDQLSIELNVDGKDWIVDPGTYLYTPLPHRRNEYRSVHAHFAPRLRNGEEPGSFSKDLFWLDGDPQSRCIYFGTRGFLGVHFGYGQPIYRLIKLSDAVIEVVDWTEGSIPLALIGPGTIDAPIAPAVPMSPGYGVQWVH